MGLVLGVPGLGEPDRLSAGAVAGPSFLFLDCRAGGLRSGACVGEGVCLGLAGQGGGPRLREGPPASKGAGPACSGGPLASSDFRLRGRPCLRKGPPAGQEGGPRLLEVPPAWRSGLVWGRRRWVPSPLLDVLGLLLPRGRPRLREGPPAGLGGGPRLREDPPAGAVWVCVGGCRPSLGVTAGPNGLHRVGPACSGYPGLWL